jgi:glycosyltransferase involved in cell wall biosynthesis
VPIYRTPERYLQEMAQSVCSQSFPDFELILVNASPDDLSCSASLRVLEEKDRRVRVLPLSENQGIAQNTNAGLFSARGEYVCFMDHDDRIEPDALYHSGMTGRAGKSISSRISSLTSIWTCFDPITTSATS